MSVRRELHDLVDRLGDERAREVLTHLRRLLGDGDTATQHREARLGALMAPGDLFFSQPRTDLETLATWQGVRPVRDIGEMFGDFWPPDEAPDEFAEAVRRWRREGGRG
jgi:hypothetical protein